MLVRVSMMYCICFLIGSSWKQFTLCYFVLIHVRINVGYELQLAFCLVRVIVSFFV